MPRISTGSPLQTLLPRSLLVSGEYFPPQRGGISSFMKSVVYAMGPERISCLTGVTGSAGREMDNAYRVYRRPSAFARSRLVQAVGFASSLTEIMLRERPQLLQLATIHEAVFGLWMQRWLKVPFVVFAHGNEILAARDSTYVAHRLALRRADRVLANSSYTADLLESMEVERHRIDIVHPVCDPDAFRPMEPDPEYRRELLGERAGNPILMTLGHLTERKGQDRVIQALPRIVKRFPDLTYLMVGNGPYQEDLERLAKSLGVGDHVVFAGFIPLERLAATYNLCDVFVMVSREIPEKSDVEGFGIVYLEANACGKPVVGSWSGGIPDAIANGESGLLVDPDDPSAIAESVIHILSQPVLARRLGEQGRRRVLQDFTVDSLRERLVQVLSFLSD